MMVVNRLRGTVGSVGVKAPDSGERRREFLDDLAVLTGGRLFSTEIGRSLEAVEASDFGRASRVVVDRERTTIVGGGGESSWVRDRIAQVETLLKRADSEYDRERLRARLARLSGGVAVIRVGGATEVELKERRSRLEDALAATKAAVEEGVVPGGGVALLRCRVVVAALKAAGDEAVGRDIVLRTLEAPLRQIAFNAGAEPDVIVGHLRASADGMGYNALTGREEDLIAAGVLDPAMVTRVALQNAASIATLVMTTDAIVVEEDEEGEEEGQSNA